MFARKLRPMLKSRLYCTKDSLENVAKELGHLNDKLSSINQHHVEMLKLRKKENENFNSIFNGILFGIILSCCYIYYDSHKYELKAAFKKNYPNMYSQFKNV